MQLPDPHDFAKSPNIEVDPMTTTHESTNRLFAPLRLPRGPVVKNRSFLAPLTNCQSGEDGSLSEEECRWLTLRGKGGFGLTNTCASHVRPEGKGFAGQLGCFEDVHLPGLRRLANGLRNTGLVSALQPHHAGIRALATDNDLVGPSADKQSGARALSESEIELMIQSFVDAALRAEKAGFDGVQIHAGHGYLIAQFLSPELNRRTDKWGGSAENRARFLFDILHSIRVACGPSFQIGVRISTERFGLVLPDMIELASQLFADGAMDYLDLSLWDMQNHPRTRGIKSDP